MDNFFPMNCFIPVFKRWALEPDHWSLKSALLLDMLP